MRKYIQNLFKGWIGEKKASLNIWVSLNANVYHRVHDLIIPSRNGTTQIDHLLVSKYGLFIVETKNRSGWIFGAEDQVKWTQSLIGPRKFSIFGRRHSSIKYTFQNPLRQTFRQKKCLSEFLDL
ncbi:MAG: NERD domain-containing protein, partial [Candidatus Heimdallarchaeota archaeon]